MPETSTLWALFGSSFLSSTLLPGGSELILAYTTYEAIAPVPLLWGIATLGNTLGGLTSWILGWWLDRRFPGSALHRPEHRKALTRIQHYGSPLLLLSWLPLIGDPLCVAAGWTGIRLLPVAFYIGIGKGLRYALLLTLPLSG